MAKRSRLAQDVIDLAKTLKVDDKLEGLRDEDLREVDLEMAVALGMERPKAAKIACRIRLVSAAFRHTGLGAGRLNGCCVYPLQVTGSRRRCHHAAQSRVVGCGAQGLQGDFLRL